MDLPIKKDILYFHVDMEKAYFCYQNLHFRFLCEDFFNEDNMTDHADTYKWDEGA